VLLSIGYIAAEIKKGGVSLIVLQKMILNKKGIL